MRESGRASKEKTSTSTPAERMLSICSFTNTPNQGSRCVGYMFVTTRIFTPETYPLVGSAHSAKSRVATLVRRRLGFDPPRARLGRARTVGPPRSSVQNRLRQPPPQGHDRLAERMAQNPKSSPKRA